MYYGNDTTDTIWIRRNSLLGAFLLRLDPLERFKIG